MIVTSLASGSSGNATLICGKNSCIIVDLGISYKKTETALHSKGYSIEDVSALFITHGHSDHASGVRTFKKKSGIPIYGTYETSDIYVEQRGGYGEYQEMGVEIDNFIKEGQEKQIGDLTVEAVRVSHDARHPVSYMIHNGNRSVAVSTDLGESNMLLERRLSDCDVILIEANHDMSMLEKGPYPLMLKRRIRGARGHLSNRQTAKILRTSISDDTNILLGHLSQINNTPQLAVQTVHGVMRQSGFKTEKIRALSPYNDQAEIKI